MIKNKILNVIIVFLIILIIIGLLLTVYFYSFRDNKNYVTISVLDQTGKIIEINNNSIVPNIVYDYSVLIESEKTGVYKIIVNVINDSINELEKYLEIEIQFLNNILYVGELKDLINNQISFDYSLIEDEKYILYVRYYLKNEIGNEIQLMKSEFDFIVTVKEER